MKYSKKTFIFSAVCILALLSGCQSCDKPSIEPNCANSLTHGNVQLTLKKGETTQTEVLEAFGAPNITTIDASGCEVWTYQKQATVANSNSKSSGYWLIFLGGNKNESGFEQGSRTMTLIIHFDTNKKVADFRSFASSF